MSFYVYILQSETSDRYYCGQTSDLERRVRQHNDPDYQFSKTTKRFEGPWKMIWSKESDTRSEAMIMERSIKKRGIGRFLDKELVESRQRRD